MAETTASNEALWLGRLERMPCFSCAIGWGAGQALEGFWRDVFAGAKPGSHVLEIGCGSGHVSLWAAEAKRGLKVIASDLRDEARWSWSHADVSYLGCARAEALAVPDASIDLFVSNFAFEYARHEAAVSEMQRVLRDDGFAVLVLHRADSVISANNHAVIETYEGIERGGYIRLIHQAAALPRNDPSREETLTSVLSHRDAFPKPRLDNSGVEYFDIAQRLLSGDEAAGTDLERLDEDVAERLALAREQLRAALDERALSRLGAQLRAKGLSFYTSDLTFTQETAQANRLGWILIATKGNQLGQQ